MSLSPNVYKFLQLFKDGEINRRQVYSYPALYRLMELGLVKHQKGPTYDLDVYRITDAGKKMLGPMVTNGER